MDMSSSTMSMSASGTAAATATTTSAEAMNMGGGSSCKISMLWNWYTVDSCFIARSWHVTSHGMFAGSCIGVILLVICLEFLRRVGKEYDRYLVRTHQGLNQRTTSMNKDATQVAVWEVGAGAFKPSVLQQAIRALLHMVQFAVAYFIMLLAMYYNGYVIICIFIGAYIGSFIFSWESLGGSKGNGQTSVANEATVCCG